MLSPSSTAERAETFAPFASRRVGDAFLSDFIAQRTALLVGGMPDEAMRSHAFGSMSEAVKAAHGKHALGTAAAVDRRGYFLTAAHCIRWQPLHVVYPDGGDVRVARARVVWHGDPRKEGSDLAVVAIGEPLREVFAWAETVAVGDAVLGAGPNYDGAERFGLGFFSGVAVKLESNPDSKPPGTTLYHTGPMHLGDSGGPLTTPDGKLVGINVGDIHELNVFRLSYKRAARAHRPNPALLRELIERDAAAPRPAPMH